MNLADQPSTSRVLYLVVCAAPPARDVHVLVDLAQKAGWDACVVATPRAFQWIDAPALSERTGHPVRYDYKLPGEPDLLSPPDAIIVAPATFNTINKWASGISDTLALGLLCEAIGMELPVVVLPYLNAAQGKHPALADSIQRLRGCGVPSALRPRCAALASPSRGSTRAVPMAPNPGGAGRLLMRVACLPHCR